MGDLVSWGLLFPLILVVYAKYTAEKAFDLKVYSMDNQQKPLITTSAAHGHHLVQQAQLFVPLTMFPRAQGAYLVYSMLKVVPSEVLKAATG